MIQVALKAFDQLQDLWVGSFCFPGVVVMLLPRAVEWLVAYVLLARALRRADQEGMKRGHLQILILNDEIAFQSV